MKRSADDIRDSWKVSLLDKSKHLADKDFLRRIDLHDFMMEEISNLEDIVEGDKKINIVVNLSFILISSIICSIGLDYEFMNWQSVAIMAISVLLYKFLNFLVSWL